MGILKKAAKSGLLGIGPQVLAGGQPSGVMGTLASALGIEAKQHEQHDKVKHIHHHYGNKKK